MSVEPTFSTPPSPLTPFPSRQNENAIRGGRSGGPDGTRLDDERLLRAVRAYLQPDEVALVERGIAYLRESLAARSAATGPESATSRGPEAPLARPWYTDAGLEYALAVGQTLAETLHVDAVTLAAVLLSPLVSAREATLDEVRERLDGVLGDHVARTIASLERFDALQRPAADLRRSARKAQQALSEQGEPNPERRRSRERQRERQRQEDADALRKMFVALAEDPRVVLIKLADQIRTMRAVRKAADRLRAAQATSTPDAPTEGHTPLASSTSAGGEAAAFPWTLDECQMLARETRDVYAPLAGRLGLSLVESELDDLAFAVLEPDEFAKLSAAVAKETSIRRDYVDRVCGILRDEVAKLGIHADISGRVKHLYSIYKKVRRSGTFDLGNLYDILAFRITVETVEECYQVLGHVHELWRPKEGRIKDFIASPKPNGYQSLHTTVFCLDGRLAEIQIRTRAMHQAAEYGVAMHWYYKDVGDAASAKAKSLQAWIHQVREWQRELAAAATGSDAAMEMVTSDALREQIYVFTPAGDAKELPAGATPLDFAYRVHSDLGNHVAGVRITSEEGGRLTKKLVPLDYELRNGDVVQIIKRNSAHPTRDWMRVAKTKVAQQHIQRYLNSAEKEQNLILGRERLERELVALGLKRGLDDLNDGDALWVAQEFGLKNLEALLVGIGSERLRLGSIVTKLRDRLRIQSPEEAPAEEPVALTLPARPKGEFGASVQGMTGMLTRLATCCNPIPSDELLGYVTRGRGIVVHRADCPSLLHLIEREPGRKVAVSWPSQRDGQQTFKVPVHIEGTDRLGLAHDVSGVISARNINMSRFDVTTRHAAARAIITAVLELERPEQLEGILRAVRGVEGVYLAERKQPRRAVKASAASEGAKGKGRK